MAKLKVQSTTVTKKSRKDELKEPDEVKEALHVLSEHLSKYFARYVVGLIALIAFVLGVDYFIQYKVSQGVAESQSFEEALGTLNGSVAADAADESLLPPTSDAKQETQFATLSERSKTAAEKASAVQKELPEELASLALMVEARALADQGEWSAAEEKFKKFADEQPENNLAMLVSENRGRAAQESGNVVEAEKFYGQLAASSELYYKVRGHMLTGDLYNPAMGKGKGKDASKSRAEYDAALKSLVPSEGQVFGASLRGLRSEIKRRQSLIGQ